MLKEIAAAMGWVKGDSAKFILKRMQRAGLVRLGLKRCEIFVSGFDKLIVSLILMKTAPTTQPEEKTRAAKIVQVIEVKPRNERISVAAYGVRSFPRRRSPSSLRSAVR